jgi:hypothetical protein
MQTKDCSLFRTNILAHNSSEKSEAKQSLNPNDIRRQSVAEKLLIGL